MSGANPSDRFKSSYAVSELKNIHELRVLSFLWYISSTILLPEVSKTCFLMNKDLYDYKELITKYPELHFAHDELLDLINKHGMPKLGRWTYCKYCYKHVLPMLSFSGGLILCPKCQSGLAPLKDVIKAGSLKKWEQDLEFLYKNLK